MVIDIVFTRLNNHEIFVYLSLEGSIIMEILAKPVEILLVEDNKGDIGLIEEVFEEAKIRNNLHVAEDGEEAILFLHGEGTVSYTHLRAHETDSYLVCRLLLEKKKHNTNIIIK